MRRLSSRLTSGRNSTPRTSVKIAAFAPIPSARVKITVMAKPLLRHRERIEYFIVSSRTPRMEHHTLDTEIPCHNSQNPTSVHVRTDHRVAISLHPNSDRIRSPDF